MIFVKHVIIYKSKTGTIIIIERNDNLDLLIKTGRAISSNLSQIMIESIFKNAPLHDRKIIIINKKIIGARCVYISEKIQYQLRWE